MRLIYTNFKTTVVLLLLLVMAVDAQGQDIHFSQFYNSPLNINPALTGVFPEDVRISGHYRRQWQSVPVPYLTFSGAYDSRLYHPIAPSGFFGYGVLFNYDRQGIADLQLTQLSLSGSYTQPLNEYNLLTAGVQVGFANRGFATDDLTFANQYNGDVFDPGLPTREDFSNTSRSFFDLGAGLNWLMQLDGGFRLNSGLGVFHLTTPEVNFFDQTKANLPMRFSLYTIGSAPLNARMDMQFRLMYQNQSPFRETLLGTALVYYLNRGRGQELAVQLGTNYRRSHDESDAIIPTFGVRYLMWRAEFSYDINTSKFQEATNGNGGPEISVIYTITKVKPPAAFKACPIF